MSPKTVFRSPTPRWHLAQVPCCHACLEPLQAGLDGKIHFLGFREEGSTAAFLWGPVPIHPDCMPEISTPFDDRIGTDVVPVLDRIVP